MIPKQPINSMRVYGTTSQYTTPPSNSEIDAGVEPLDSLPADWWNWLWNQVTLEEGHTVQFCNSLFAEISTVLTAAGVTPKEANTNDLLNAIYKITQAIATTEKAGSIKASLVSGRIYVDRNEGWAEVNDLGTPSSLNTTSKEVVGAINELKKSISDLNTTLTDMITTKVEAEATARAEADSALGERITNEATARAEADTALQTSITTLDSAAVKSVNNVKPTNGNVSITVDTAVLKDSSVTTAKIAGSAVTTAKIADSAVTNAKIAGTIPIEKGGTGATTAAAAFKALAAGPNESTLYIQEDDPLLYQSGGTTWKKSSFLTAIKSLWSIFNDKQPAEFPTSYITQCLKGRRQYVPIAITQIHTYAPANTLYNPPITVAVGNNGLMYGVAGIGKIVKHGLTRTAWLDVAVGYNTGDTITSPIIYIAWKNFESETIAIAKYNSNTDVYITSSGTTSTPSVYWNVPTIYNTARLCITSSNLVIAGTATSQLYVYTISLTASASTTPTSITIPKTASGDTPSQVGRMAVYNETSVLIPTNYSGLYLLTSGSTTATLLTYTGYTRNDYFNAVAVSSSGTIVAAGNVLIYGTQGNFTMIDLTYTAVVDIAYIEPEDVFFLAHTDASVYGIFNASTGEVKYYSGSPNSSSSYNRVVYNERTHVLTFSQYGGPTDTYNYIYDIPASPNSLFKINNPGTLEVPSLGGLAERIAWLEQQVSKTT